MTFFYGIRFEQLSLQNRWLIKKVILFYVKQFLKTTIKRGHLGPVWDKPAPDRWLCFCPNFLSFYWSSLDAFGEFFFQKLMAKQLFGLEFWAVRQDTFHPHQDFEQVNFYKKKRVFISLVGPSKTGESQLIYNWLQIGTFQAKFDKIYFLINIPKLFTLLCKRKIKISSLCKA